MRFAILFCGVLILAGAAKADPLASTDPAAAMRDPSPSDSHDFSHTLANGGTADVGQKLGAAPVAAQAGCKAANPCAVPPAPQQHVLEPPPSHPS